jgi:hypothetical protein
MQNSREHALPYFQRKKLAVERALLRPIEAGKPYASIPEKDDGMFKDESTTLTSRSFSLGTVGKFFGTS